MQKIFYFFYISIWCIFPSTINFLNPPKVFAKESINLELEREIKNGNFLIGIKQYLGGGKDNFSNNDINFATSNSFINLHSLNGIKYKSKNFNISWKNIPINNPYTIERIVFGPYSSYESAQKQATSLRDEGFEATVTYPESWEVWIPFENDLPNQKLKYKILKKFYDTQITPFINTEYNSQQLEGPIYIYSDEEIKINNISFGKEFYLVKDSYGTWTLVQKIKFNDYLEGVLPYEIGPNSPMEALKAQAVIARTWGIYNSERFRMDQYHLCITTQCQVYKPPKFENRRVQQAIKETSNLIITYNNQPINSFYHGSNGGISARASESWIINDYSYFKIKLDGSKTLTKSFKPPIRNDYELNQFFKLDQEKFYGNEHSLFRWNKKISSFSIKDSLIKNKLVEVHDDVVDLNVIERGLSGRAKKLEIKMKIAKKPILLERDDIRRILNFFPSNLFTINKLNDNLWLFRGGGFGHGVGLSQSGAIEMAELGFTYEQILNHYFQGTKLKKIEILSQ